MQSKIPTFARECQEIEGDVYVCVREKTRTPGTLSIWKFSVRTKFSDTPQVTILAIAHIQKSVLEIFSLFQISRISHEYLTDISKNFSYFSRQISPVYNYFSIRVKARIISHNSQALSLRKSLGDLHEISQKSHRNSHSLYKKNKLPIAKSSLLSRGGCKNLNFLDFY